MKLRTAFRTFICLLFEGRPAGAAERLVTDRQPEVPRTRVPVTLDRRSPAVAVVCGLRPLPAADACGDPEAVRPATQMDIAAQMIPALLRKTFALMSSPSSIVSMTLSKSEKSSARSEQTLVISLGVQAVPGADRSDA